MSRAHPDRTVPHFADPIVDLLVWLVCAMRGQVDLDAYPSRELFDTAQRAGLVRPGPKGWPLPTPTPRGSKLMLEACTERERHASELAYGRVRVVDGPFRGEVGLYDDDDNLAPRGPFIGPWHPGERALVLLDSQGPGWVLPEYIPHHWLEPEQQAPLTASRNARAV